MCLDQNSGILSKEAVSTVSKFYVYYYALILDIKTHFIVHSRNIVFEIYFVFFLYNLLKK